MSKIIKLTTSVLVPLLVGYLSSLFTRAGVTGWYATANKPFFNPPNWVFAPTWTVLYIMMGIAFYLVWISRVNEQIKRKAMIVFALQLLLNFLWSFIFFDAQMLGLAFAEIILLWIMILLTILYFKKISGWAAALLLPYIAWVSFATILNYSIWQLN